MRFGDIVLRRTPVGDGAVGAVSGADVTEDHKGRGAVLPTLADVRAVRFLAYGMQVELTHQVLEPHVVGASGCSHLEPRRFPLRERFRAVSPHDLIESIWHRLQPAGRKESVELRQSTSKTVGAKL